MEGKPSKIRFQKKRSQKSKHWKKENVNESEKLRNQSKEHLKEQEAKYQTKERKKGVAAQKSKLQ